VVFIWSNGILTTVDLTNFSRLHSLLLMNSLNKTEVAFFLLQALFSKNSFSDWIIQHKPHNFIICLPYEYQSKGHQRIISCIHQHVFICFNRKLSVNKTCICIWTYKIQYPRYLCMHTIASVLEIFQSAVSLTLNCIMKRTKTSLYIFLYIVSI